jgi:hypothetical protein
MQNQKIPELLGLKYSYTMEIVRIGILRKKALLSDCIQIEGL